MLKALEGRINAALRASSDNNLRFLSIDDLMPGLPPNNDGIIEDIAYLFGDSTSQYRYRIELTPAALALWRAGRFGAMLPPNDTSDWFTLDRRAKTILIRLDAPSA